MKTKQFLFAALAAITLAGCSMDEFMGDNSPTVAEENTAEQGIYFGLSLPNMTRAGELTGATAADMLGRMFVVEGTKGTEQENSPSTTVVFDNYLVGYEYNSAGRTESNTNNWEYVGLNSTGISGRMTADTWSNLHPTGTGVATAQTIKYWDYSTTQYDFIAWSTGDCEAVTTAAESGKVKVTRINTGTTLSTTTPANVGDPVGGFTMSVANATDLSKCYYTDINTVAKANYGAPVTLKFRNMAAKVRVALYETVPGYSVKDVKFYSAESDKDGTPAYDPEDLGTGTSTNATLFTTGSNKLPLSGDILVYYPRIGTNGSSAEDYNKASVTVTAGSTDDTKQTFGTLSNFVGKEGSEANNTIYLGRTLPQATFAGNASENYYTAVFPNTNGTPLTLRVDYTLVPIDGAGEVINVYGAKAVVPATYTNWLPNYAYTYIFKISDNTNGWTSQTGGSPEGDPGLFPITFDAIVANFIDVNAEQTTVTTVATPSITTYQQGHTKASNEYYYQQKAGADQTNYKDLYVQVMDNSTATPTLKTDLQGTGEEAGKKSLLYKITKKNASDEDEDYVASEAEVMDVLQNRTNTYSATSPEGRNGIKLTKNDNIANDVEQIVNGVNDQPITVTAGTAAKIDIDQLAAGTYAYVYATTVPTSDEKIYNVVNATNSNYTNYYPVKPSSTATPIALSSPEAKAIAGKVYFVKNVDANGEFVSYTFKQTKVGDVVTGLVEADVPTSTATGDFDDATFYFDVYNQNKGAYAVKVIKVTTTAP